MVMKYTFSLMGNDSLDIITKLFFTVHNLTNDLFVYFVIALIGIVSYYVFIKKTQDIGKSGVSSLHIIFISTVLLYYWGKAGDYNGLTGGTFVNESLLFIVSIGYVLFLVGIKFFKKAE